MGELEIKLVNLRIEDKIGIIILNNPPVNVLNKDLLDDLEKVIDFVANNQEIKVIVLTGEGKAFAAGADIKSMPELKYDGGKALALRGQSIFEKLEKMDKPSICYINGVALGGGLELAMSTDMRVASENAKVGQPEINLGIIPGYGGTQRLARLVGKPKAKYLVLTGDTISAEQAKNIGLVNAVYPAESAMEKVMETAKKMAEKSMMALKYAKKAIDEGMEQGLYEGLKTEAHYFGLACDTEDKNEGVLAFMQKRPANFQDK